MALDLPSIIIGIAVGWCVVKAFYWLVELVGRAPMNDG